MSAQISLIIKAVDEATSMIRKISDETSSAMEQVKAASESVAQAHKINWSETKNLITSFSSLATCAFALYSAVDKVSDAQLGLQRAQLQVQAATNAVEDAQRRYLAALEKHGEDSEQAQAALKDLQLAQERLNYAAERAQQIQENYNQLQIQTAIGVIPMLITAVDSVKDAFNAVKDATDLVSGALNFLAANPIMLVIAAVAALVSTLVYLYQTNEDFRNAVNALGETLANFFKPILDTIIGAFAWLYDNVLKPIGNFIINYFIAYWRALGAVWDALKGSWDAFVGALKWGYDTFIKPIIDALSWFYENIIKPVAGFFAGLGGMGAAPAPAAPTTPGVYGPYGVPGFQHGGIVTQPTLALLGETGPEAVIPLERFNPAPSIQFNAPLVYVEGSADEKTARRAVEEIERKLKTVLIETTSNAAPTKRIRLSRGILGK